MEFAAAPMSRLRFPTAAPIREVWPNEAVDFTPWLSKNLEALDVLELGRLECAGVEVILPNTYRSLDIQARTPTGEIVAIENQFGRADHDHLTRGLAYAVGLQARALVVVAEEHRGEFRAIAQYLNRLAETSTIDEAIRIYLVEVSVEAVEEYVVPRFRVVEQPNEWLAAATDTRPPQRYQSIDEFLDACVEGARSVFREVVEWWVSQGGSVRHNAQLSLSLDRPHPARPQRALSHLLLNTNGTYTVQRGYLREAGVVTDDLVDAFDALVHAVFPDAMYVGKEYFLNSRNAPSPAAVQEYWRWLETH